MGLTGNSYKTICKGGLMWPSKTCDVKLQLMKNVPLYNASIHIKF